MMHPQLNTAFLATSILNIWPNLGCKNISSKALGVMIFLSLVMVQKNGGIPCRFSICCRVVGLRWKLLEDRVKAEEGTIVRQMSNFLPSMFVLVCLSTLACWSCWFLSFLIWQLGFVMLYEIYLCWRPITMCLSWKCDHAYVESWSMLLYCYVMMLCYSLFGYSIILSFFLLLTCSFWYSYNVLNLGFHFSKMS